MSTLEVARRVAGSRCFLRQSGALVGSAGSNQAAGWEESTANGRESDLDRLGSDTGKNSTCYRKRLEVPATKLCNCGSLFLHRTSRSILESKPLREPAGRKACASLICPIRCDPIWTGWRWGRREGGEGRQRTSAARRFLRPFARFFSTHRSIDRARLPVQFSDDAGNGRMPEWEEGRMKRADRQAGESAPPNLVFCNILKVGKT